MYDYEVIIFFGIEEVGKEATCLHSYISSMSASSIPLDAGFISSSLKSKDSDSIRSAI